MKTSRENLVRLKLFNVNHKRRRVAQLDGMIAEFERMATELDAQIISEETKAGITDQSHFAYPTFAKAARLRRDNLRTSQMELMQERDQAVAELAIMEDELKKAEALEMRDGRTRGNEPTTRVAAG
ncbi:flagellar export protein FliJ [Nitratireductor aestuarii]|uniref:Flagellar export protein FliJ n=1 Tax=Nitratireductor aestuarii TaxID=1735103 RepID=A0A916W6U1_9HYPH|nr:flagellar export protein FliJ [Nitratireductor aestuarii]GGA71152.1 flagellar export protein FliJ [Nitratireductor aestuarii]